MSKIALITDTHFGFKNDSNQFLDYFAKFYDKVFFPTLKAHGITSIIHLGDIVERRKYMSYTTLRRFHEIFLDKTADYATTVLVGNHDVPYRNTNEINALSEIYRRRPENFQIISEPTEKAFDNCNILLMPWINVTNYDACMQSIKASRSQVMFGHLEIKGFEMHRGQTNYDGFDRSVFDKFDVVCSGHFHRKSTNKNINYLGSPYELTWADYNDVRGFHFFDTETRNLTFIKNPFSLYKKLWYNDKDKVLKDILDIDCESLAETYVKIIVSEKTNSYWFEQYVELVNLSKAYSIQIVEDHKNLDSDVNDDAILDAEDTMTVITNYVQGLDTDDSSKNELHMLFRALYNEAHNMELVD